MPPILPWLPATELVFGMDKNLCKHAREKTITKTEAAVSAMRDGSKPKPWGPIDIIFHAGEQKVKFNSSVIVSAEGNGIILTMNNRMQLVDGKNIEFMLDEIVKVFFPDNEAAGVVRTLAESFVQISSDLPQSVIAALPGHKLGQIISFPDPIHNGLQDIIIIAASGRHMTLDTSTTQARAAAMHEEFANSLNHPE